MLCSEVSTLVPVNQVLCVWHGRCKCEGAALRSALRGLVRSLFCCQWKVRKGGERTGILCLLSSTSLERSVTLNDQTGSLSTVSALPTWPWLWRHKHTGGGHSKRHLKYNFQCSRGHTPPSYFPSALLVQMKQFWNSETKEPIHLINNKMGFQEMWRAVNVTDSEYEV